MRWTALILLTLVFFYKLAFTDWILGRGDTFAYFYPYWHVRDAALSAGELPLWSPDVFMGVPLLANPQLGTFYPPNWLTMRLNAPDAVRISILIHTVWAALGAYGLARRTLELDAVPALLSGAMFAFGGFVGAHVEQINQLQGLAWMPWLFWLWDRALDARPHPPSTARDTLSPKTEEGEKAGVQRLLKSSLQSLERRFRGEAINWRIIPLSIAWALQLLSGHTQTAFIAGVGLGIYGLWRVRYGVYEEGLSPPPTDRPHWAQTSVKPIFMLLAAALLAMLIASPQLIPTQELISLSNRGGGLNRHEATAFSLNPFLIGRGLLPSYDAQPFGEYVGYVGVIGLGLAIVGALSPGRRRWVWIVLAGMGLLLALGRHNPVYWTLAGLPGFNLFRVPARWLVLYVLGLAMLAGCGAQNLSVRPLSIPLGETQDRTKRVFRSPLHLLERGCLAQRGRGEVGKHAPTFAAVLVIVLLAASALLSDRAADEVDGSALPTTVTWIGWGAALVGFVLLSVTSRWRPDFRLGASAPNADSPSLHSGEGAGGEVRKSPRTIIVAALAVAELWFASQSLPYNNLTDPAIYERQRFAVSQMQVYGEGHIPPGRLLTISGLLFDPGDKATLERRWDRLGLGERAARYAFTATKMQETLTPNLPLLWGVPSVDGFDGGVLPTLFYTQFTSLLLPQGTLRTLDGRLYQVLAQPACRGACIPDDRWLDLMNVRYLLTDKVYDLWHDDIAYDTQFTASLAAGESLTLDATPLFEADALHILYTCRGTSCRVPTVELSPGHGSALPLHIAAGDEPLVDDFYLARYRAEAAVTPAQIILTAEETIDLHAMTLVDARTGDFVQLTPPGWERIYSADIKIYENTDVLPRAFVVHDAVVLPDTWEGTEQALDLMRDPAFDPAQTVVIHSDDITAGARPDVSQPAIATITEYTPTRVVVEYETQAPGYLVLTDAYYPGWIAGDGDSTAHRIYRADVIFRAVRIHPGQAKVVFEYQPRPARDFAGWIILGAIGVGRIIVARLCALKRDRGY